MGIIAIVQGFKAKKLGYTGGKANVAIILGIIGIVLWVYILVHSILPFVTNPAGGADHTGSYQTLNVSESGLTIQIPANWVVGHSSQDAVLEMNDPAQNKGFFVIEELKEDFADGFALEDYVTAIRQNMSVNSDTPEAPEIIDVQIGDGISARQFVMSITLNYTKLSYQVTCVDANGYFFQFIGWSVRSEYAKAETVFNDILGNISFTTNMVPVSLQRYRI